MVDNQQQDDRRAKANDQWRKPCQTLKSADFLRHYVPADQDHRDDRTNEHHRGDHHMITIAADDSAFWWA